MNRYLDNTLYIGPDHKKGQLFLELIDTAPDYGMEIPVSARIEWDGHGIDVTITDHHMDCLRAALIAKIKEKAGPAMEEIFRDLNSTLVAGAPVSEDERLDGKVNQNDLYGRV